VLATSFLAAGTVVLTRTGAARTAHHSTGHTGHRRPSGDTGAWHTPPRTAGVPAGAGKDGRQAG